MRTERREVCTAKTKGNWTASSNYRQLSDFNPTYTIISDKIKQLILLLSFCDQNPRLIFF